MKTTFENFKSFVENQNDLKIEFHGRYDGRFFHKGIAVEGDIGDLGRLVERLSQSDLSLSNWDHIDNMGYDQIVSWNANRFEDAQ